MKGMPHLLNATPYDMLSMVVSCHVYPNTNVVILALRKLFYYLKLTNVESFFLHA